MTEHPEDRSKVMRAVKGRDTEPEMAVRRLTHGMGLPLSPSSQRSSWQPGSGVPHSSKGDLRAWMLLAPAPLLARSAVSEVEPGLLDPEAPTQQATRCGAPDSFTRDGLGRAGDLGMRDEGTWRGSGANQGISGRVTSDRTSYDKPQRNRDFAPRLPVYRRSAKIAAGTMLM